MPPAPPHPPIPLDYPTTTIYVDESGSRSTGGHFFVVAALKVRRPGQLLRALKSVRDKTGFDRPFHFADITRGALPAYYALIDELEGADVHTAASVVDRRRYDPFDSHREAWRAHAEVTSQLLVGCVNRRELVSVVLDGLSAPESVAYEDFVRGAVNRRFGETKVIGATCGNSRSFDGLQVADLIASAIGHERRKDGSSQGANSNKTKVAARLKSAFALPSFDDGRTARTNILTFRGPKRNQVPPSGKRADRGRSLSVVPSAGPRSCAS